MIIISSPLLNNKHDIKIIDDVLKNIDQKFIYYNSSDSISSDAVYSYALYKYDLSTPDGWFPQASTKSQQDYLKVLYNYIKEHDCRLIDRMNEQNVKYLITDLDIRCNNLFLKYYVDSYKIYYNK